MTSTLTRTKTNNRSKTRYFVQLQALYSSSYSNIWHSCEILNISEDGAQLNIPQYLVPGDEILLQIATEKGKIFLKGEVKYEECPKIGIQFKYKHEDINEEINTIIYKTFNEQIKRYKQGK